MFKYFFGKKESFAMFRIRIQRSKESSGEHPFHHGSGSQGTAMRWIQVPISEMLCPLKKSRKLR